MNPILAEYALQETQLMHLAREITWAGDESEVCEKLNDAVHEVGGTGWIFQAFERSIDEEQGSTGFRKLATQHDFLWMQYYQSRLMYLIDHSLLYAERNGFARRLSTIPVETDGQRALVAAAREFGIMDGYVFPAHCAEVNHVGALQVFWSGNHKINQDRVSALSVAMRAVTTAALERMLSNERDELIRRIDLSERDVILLRYGSQGYSSREIAELEGRNKRTIDLEFQRTSRKLGVTKRSAAVDVALRIGLI
jgi:DNA-binding NarL/FixJ family response regulator